MSDREPKKCFHCDYMRRPILKEIPAHGWVETWGYCPTHGVYSDWDTELPESMKKERTMSPYYTECEYEGCGTLVVDAGAKHHFCSKHRPKRKEIE